MTYPEQTSPQNNTLTLREKFELLNTVNLQTMVYDYYGTIRNLDVAIDYIHYLESELKNRKE